MIYKAENLIKKRLYITIALLLLGLIYYLFIQIFGFALPCIFNLVTTLDCPGCGISAVAVAVLQGDYFAAFKANMGLLVIMPLLVPTLLICWLDWIFGKKKIGHLLELALLFCLVWLLAWGICRNIPRFIEIINNLNNLA